MLGTGLAPVTYVAGSAAIFAVVAALAWGAWRVRAAVLPQWAGPPARLAEAVIGLTALLGVAQLLGSLGAFTRGWMLVALVAVGLAMGRIATPRVDASASQRSDDPTPVTASQPRARREEVVVATLAAAVVTAQWVTHVAVAFGRGMTHPDTLWYHAPYAARFVQDGRITELTDRSDVIQAYFPLNSQLVHAVAILPFERDVLSPLLNLGWASLALLGAWCIGRRRGLGALSVLSVVVVLGLPMLAGTHPGQASNDVACAALVLAVVALLFEGDLAPAPTALAALAAGLALGTKVTVALPVAALTVGVVVLAFRRRHRIVAAVWCGGVVLSGGYWFGRNWALADNPLPWFDINLGPLSLPASAKERGAAIVDHLSDGAIWSDVYLPGLSQSLGRLWPVVLGIGLSAIVLAISRRGDPLLRLTGVALAAGAVGYVFTPSGGGFNFPFNVRYLAPVLLVAFALLPLTIERFSGHVRRVTLVVLVALVVSDVTSPHRERITAWPRGYLAAAVLAGTAVVVTVAFATRPRTRRQTSALLAAAAVLAVVLLIGGGWAVQHRYLDGRYADAGLALDAVNAPFRHVDDAPVAVFGTVEVYPMFGLDLSNRVAQRDGSNLGADPCRAFRDVRRGRYKYVVLTQFGIVFGTRPPNDWFTDDPAATEVTRSGDGVVYRIDGPLHPAECR
jgi:hypothetical protein